MAVSFALGARAEERDWLDPPPAWLPRTCLRAGVLAVLAVGVVIAASDHPDPFLGGWHLQELAEPICEATIAVSMSLWVALRFARHVTYRERLARAFGRASYATYVVHAPVVVALAGIGVAAEVKSSRLQCSVSLRRTPWDIRAGSVADSCPATPDAGFVRVPANA